MVSAEMNSPPPADPIGLYLAQLELAIFDVSFVAQCFPLHAVFGDPDKMQVVGENDVLRQRLVFRDLLALFGDLVHTAA